MSLADIATSGPIIVAAGVSAAAGLVSFLSPCVLPLVPGYVSYVTGLAGADLDAALGTDPLGRPVPSVDPAEPAASGGGAGAEPGSAGGGVATEARPVPPPLTAKRARGRILAGSLLFIAGFTVVFTLTIVLASGVGRALQIHERTVQFVVGLAIILLGVTFLGLVPGLQREVRIRKLPAAGLAGAPMLGAVFALGWVPCIGPTLGAVMGLSFSGGQPGRAAVLGVAYCVGLGLPFLAFALGFRRLLGVFAVIRRNSRWVTRIGGALLLVIGVAMVTGGWGDFMNWLRATVGTTGVNI